MGAPDAAFVIEWPGDLTHGDFATNAALAASKAVGRNPRELADELVPLIVAALGDDAASVTTAGPGFINIVLSRAVVARSLDEARAAGEIWGTNDSKEGKRVMVEYSCPNPFKEMHIGHLMSTVIGEAVARSIQNAGATTFRDTYGGDVGPHVARALWGLMQKGITEPATAKEVGDAYVHGSRAYEESPEAKGEIDALNKAVYQGEDATLMELWRKGRDVSMAAYQDLWKLLDAKFDFFFFESETATPGMDAVKRHIGEVFEESEGAVIYRGEKKGLHTLVFITSQGTPTYETKDIGLAYLKEEWCPADEVYILTAAEQVGHFQVVKAALEDIAPTLGAKMTHIPHGFLRLTTGKMSSREGNIVTAASLIEDVVAKTTERNEDPLIAEQVAMAAIKYSILKQSTGSDIIFDFEKSLSLEGDSGPYLQYATVRTASILAQADESKEIDSAPETPYDIERLIIRFPEVALRASREHAPHHIAQYLTQLAGEWNSFYAKERIIGGEHEAYKLRIARAFLNTMTNGLRVLGIPVPEKM